jgi:hypothetical protein
MKFIHATIALVAICLLVYGLARPSAADSSLDTTGANSGQTRDTEEDARRAHRVMKDMVLHIEGEFEAALIQRYSGATQEDGRNYAELVARLFRRHRWALVESLSRVANVPEERFDRFEWTTLSRETFAAELAALDAIDLLGEDALYVLAQAGGSFSTHIQDFTEVFGRPGGAVRLVEFMVPLVDGRLAHVYAQRDPRFLSNDPLYLLEMVENASFTEPEEQRRPPQSAELLFLDNENDKTSIDSALRSLLMYFRDVLEPSVTSRWLDRFQAFPGLITWFGIQGHAHSTEEGIPAEGVILERLAEWRGILDRQRYLFALVDEVAFEWPLNDELAVFCGFLARQSADGDRLAYLNSAPVLGPQLHVIATNPVFEDIFRRLREVVPADFGDEWIALFLHSQRQWIVGTLTGLESQRYRERLGQLQTVVRLAVDGGFDLSLLLTPDITHTLITQARTITESGERFRRLVRIAELLPAGDEGGARVEDVYALLGLGYQRQDDFYEACILVASDLMNASTADSTDLALELSRALALDYSVQKLRYVEHDDADSDAESLDALIREVITKAEGILRLHLDRPRERERALYFLSDHLSECTGDVDIKTLERTNEALGRALSGIDNIATLEFEGTGQQRHITRPPRWYEYLPGYSVARVFTIMRAGYRPKGEEWLMAAIDAASLIPIGVVAARAAAFGVRAGAGVLRNRVSAVARGLASGIAFGAPKVVVGMRVMHQLTRAAVRTVSSRLSRSGASSARIARESRLTLRAAKMNKQGAQTIRPVAAGNPATFGQLLRQTGAQVVRAIPSGRQVVQFFADFTANTMQAMLRAGIRGASWFTIVIAKGATLYGAAIVTKQILEWFILDVVPTAAFWVGRSGQLLRESVEAFLDGRFAAILQRLGISDVDGLRGFVASPVSYVVVGLIVLLLFSALLGVLRLVPFRWVQAGASGGLWSIGRVLAWVVAGIGLVGTAAIALVKWVKKPFRRCDREEDGGTDSLHVALLGIEGAGKTSLLAALAEISDQGEGALRNVGGAADKKETFVQANAAMFNAEAASFPLATARDTDETSLVCKFALADQTDRRVDLSDIAGENVIDAWDRVETGSPAKDSGVKDALNRLKEREGAVWVVSAKWLVDCHAQGRLSGRLSKFVPTLRRAWRKNPKLLADGWPIVVVGADELGRKEADGTATPDEKTIRNYIEQIIGNGNLPKPRVHFVRTVDRVVSNPNFASVDADKSVSHAMHRHRIRPAPGAKADPSVTRLAKELSEWAKGLLDRRQHERRMRRVAVTVGSLVFVCAFLAVGLTNVSARVAEAAGAHDEVSHLQSEVLTDLEQVVMSNYGEDSPHSSPLRLAAGASAAKEFVAQHEWLPQFQEQVAVLNTTLSAALERGRRELLEQRPSPFVGDVPDYASLESAPEGLTPDDSSDPVARYRYFNPRLSLTLSIQEANRIAVDLTTEESRLLLASMLADRIRLEHDIVESRFGRLGEFGITSREVAVKFAEMGPEAFLSQNEAISLSRVDGTVVARHYATQLATLYAKARQDLINFRSTYDLPSAAIFPGQSDEERWGPETAAAYTELAGSIESWKAAEPFMASELSRREYMRIRQSWIRLNERRSVDGRLDGGNSQVRNAIRSELATLQRSIAALLRENHGKGVPDFDARMHSDCAEMLRWLNEVQPAIGNNFTFRPSGWHLRFGEWERSETGVYPVTSFAWNRSPLPIDADNADEWDVTLRWSRTTAGRRSVLRGGTIVHPSLNEDGDELSGLRFLPFVPWAISLEHRPTGVRQPWLWNSDDDYEHYTPENRSVPDFGQFYQWFGWDTKTRATGRMQIENTDKGWTSKLEGTSNLPRPPFHRGEGNWRDVRDIRTWLPDRPYLTR